MKYKGSLVFLVILAVFLAYVPKAISATPACTQITNQASLSFSVGGIPQTAINSNTASFYVGVKVDVIVSNQDGANVSITPGQKKALKFTVTNNGNAVHDYVLNYEAAPNGTPSPYGGGNDSFNGTTIGIYVDTNGNGLYDDGIDLVSTTIDNLAPLGTTTYFVVYNASDLSASNGSIAVYYLLAETKWADGSNISQGSATPTSAQAGGACDGTRTIDVVFGDGDGAGSDIARDAKHSDDGAFIVSSANISVTKSVTVISDPVNGTTNPKAIPGAIVEYSIAINNSGGASAILTTITDVINNNLKIVSTANEASWTVTGSTRATTSGTLTADLNNADGLTHSNPANPGGTVTATMTTILSAEGTYSNGELKSGETVTIKFKAEIQ